MSPFFRGSVRPPRRHPRPWSMNPRLNPDVVVDGDTNEKYHHAGTGGGLPVTNSIYGRPGFDFFSAAGEDPLPAPTGRHTAGGETQAAAAPETNGGTTTDPSDDGVPRPAEPTADPGDEVVAETTHPGQPLSRDVTRDSGTAMIESPYLNDFVEKRNSSGPSSHEEGALDVPPPDAGHARADSSTIGASGTAGISGPVQDAQAIETDEDEKPSVNGHAASDAATSSVNGAPALGEPLMDDAQLDVGDEFRPGTAVRGVEPVEPVEPLVSDEQLEVSDEFRPQANLQGPI